MEGQTLPFISFSLPNFYFLQLKIIFLTGQTEVLLHTSFVIGGDFVPSSVTKISPILDSPPSSKKSDLGYFSVFLHSRRNVVFGAASVPSIT
jgi:hypothetical protein